MEANGTGLIGTARYLNKQGLPTPIQYARTNGLNGNIDDGNGSWNSRSVKVIHEPLVNSGTFDAIQKVFQGTAYNVVPQGQSTDNNFEG